MFKKDSYLQKQMTILADSEEVLNRTLTGEDKEAFRSFANASSIIMSESELDSFIVGFRLGARMIYDTFVDDTSVFESLIKE